MRSAPSIEIGVGAIVIPVVVFVYVSLEAECVIPLPLALASGTAFIVVIEGTCPIILPAPVIRAAPLLSLINRLRESL